MGKIQCISLKNKQGSFLFIEKYLNNMNTPLEKKILEEYLSIKSVLNSYKKIESEKEQQQMHMYKKRKQRFIKWYKMANMDSNNGESKQNI
jgi:hypothetical protein